MKGQIIGGTQSEIRIREKEGQPIALGELLVTEDGSMLLQSYDLLYGSQVGPSHIELASGLAMDQPTDIAYVDEALQHYHIVLAKPVLNLGKQLQVPKILPKFFSFVREVAPGDLTFLEQPKNPLQIGKVRSGTKELSIDVMLPGEKALSHHILVSGSTGKGKSVLMKNILWNSINQAYCGILVLDPHDEYYGIHEVGMKDHPQKEKVLYYSPKHAPPGQHTLKINLAAIRPDHLSFLGFTDAQQQLLYWYYKQYGNQWIAQLLLDQTTDTKQTFQEVTYSVVKRKLSLLLDIDAANNKLQCKGVFDEQAGSTTIQDITNAITEGKLVIINTSLFSSTTELLVGALISQEILAKYRLAKREGSIDQLPVASIVLEEAPRVLGKEVVEQQANIFGTIAREGRKFKVGLFAITQLPSLIPKEVLANMNTKIILGTEMNLERQALIESASQDLSKDHRAIASLSTGEALLSSTFTKFAIPLAIPFFDNEVKKEIEEKKKTSAQQSFSGIQIK